VILLLANGLRALSIILVDHWGLADGTDHAVFSVFVYGLTLPLLAWMGSRWANRSIPLPGMFWPTVLGLWALAWYAARRRKHAV
jgi:hypothetical protein